ncbi:hypothetical protein BH23BAC3_BH23BAC3_35580 [soil metagenome]
MNRIICTGDILAADRQHTQGIGVGSRYLRYNGGNWLPVFQQIDKQSDIHFGNLEAPLVSYQPATMNKKAFAGNFRFSDWLSDAGFDVVSIANNHILEHGEKAFT